MKNLFNTKSNDFISNYVVRMNSVSELMIFEYLCSLVHTEHYNMEQDIIIMSLKDMAEECDMPKFNSSYYRKKFKETLEKLTDPSTISGFGENEGKNLKLLEKVEFASSNTAICYITEDFKIHMIPLYSFLMNII